MAHLDGVERQVRLLVDHREDLVAERTRAQQRLRWHLHELEPGWAIPAGGLDRAGQPAGATAAAAGDAVDAHAASPGGVRGVDRGQAGRRDRRVGRFRSRAAFAMHNGTAPVPVWSGNHQRHRLNRGGNRQLNPALHRIAITQLRRDGPGRDYLQRRMAAGDTKTEAIRALRRRISDEVYRRLHADQHPPGRQPTCLRPAT